MTDIITNRLTAEIVLAKTKARDLNSVRKLNCWACNLNDVSVLDQIPNLEILNLSVNNISTLEYVKSCSILCELYIRNNEINDISEIYYLKELKYLKILWLGDNKCAQDTNKYNYRMTVLRNLPNLQKLDDTDVTPEELELSTEHGILIESPHQNTELVNYALEESQLMKNQLNDLILPLTDDLKCLTKITTINNNELTNSDTLNSIDASTSLLLNNRSDDELKLLLNETIDSNFTLNHDSDNLDLVKNKKKINEINTQNLQSENVLIAITALIKDLNLDGLNMVIKECEYRKTLFYNHQI